MKLSKLLMLVAAIVWAVLTTPALAQVPPHAPGTICLYAYFLVLGEILPDRRAIRADALGHTVMSKAG